MSGRSADLAACAAGYLIGSVPIGVILSRGLRGLDVRERGSGSMGTTNVLRTIGPGAAAVTAGLDVAKGTLAVLVARRAGVGAAGQAAAGLGAVIGHCWPVFARFRGGRGVATAWGALLPISGEVSVWALAGFAAGLVPTRIVSVGSLAAAGSTVLGGVLSSARSGDALPLGYALPVSLLVVARHAANIGRLLRGQEGRMSLRRG